jgi:hypothetical protein
MAGSATHAGLAGIDAAKSALARLTGPAGIGAVNQSSDSIDLLYMEEGVRIH